MADQLPSSVDPTTGANWTGLQFLQALRVDSARLDASLQEIRAKLDIPNVPVVSADGITITGVTQSAGGAQVVLTWETDRTDIIRWMAGRDGIDLNGNGPEEYWASYAGPSVRSYAFNNLQPSKTYKLYLYGTTLEGPTERLTVTFLTRAADDPGDPLDISFGLTVTAISERQIRMDFTIPETEYGSLSLQYERHGAPNRNGETEETSGSTGGSPGAPLSYTFEDLLPETAHTIAVVGTIPDGRKAREEVEVTTLAVPGGGDGSVTATATPLDPTTLRVDWETQRTDVTNWLASAYSVEWTGEGPSAEFDDPSVRTCTLEGLLPGIDYVARVFPRTATGSLPTVAVPVTMPAAPLDADGDGIPDDEDPDDDNDGTPDTADSHNDVEIDP